MSYFVSLTRLRLRSVWFLPAFAVRSFRSIRQVERATGFKCGLLLPDRRWTFWTLTLWDSQDSMRGYMLNGDHRAAMPMLLNACDEASVAHWEQADETLPSWEEADRRMRREGRASKVRKPSRAHSALAFAPPRPGAAGPIRPRPA